MSSFDYTRGTIDSRDIIARINELEAFDEMGRLDSEDRIELFGLEQALENVDNLSMEGANIGVTLIRDEFFEDYVKELAKWCGDLPQDFDADETYIVIDWEATAENYRQDFHSVELAGARYWFQ